MREKIKIGFIGMGAVGVRILRQFQQYEDFEIAALCDRNPAQLDKWKAESAGYCNAYQLFGLASE